MSSDSSAAFRLFEVRRQVENARNALRALEAPNRGRWFGFLDHRLRARLRRLLVCRWRHTWEPNGVGGRRRRPCWACRVSYCSEVRGVRW